MSVRGELHSMDVQERALALEVIGGAWQRVIDAQAATIVDAVHAESAALPDRHPDVSTEFAQHVRAAAVWYLDRATRRVGEPDRDGFTPAQQAANLAHFAATADPPELERLFALAAALNADDA